MDIESGKVDIRGKKVDIESILSEKCSDFTLKTRIHRLFERFGFDKAFGRSAVMELQNFFPICYRQILLNQYPVMEKGNINSR